MIEVQQITRYRITSSLELNIMGKYLLLIIVSISSISTSAQIISKPVIIPVDVTTEGHILVKATVNGVEGNFIFDTGAGLNLLTKKFADKLKGLQKTDAFYTGHRATGEAIVSDLWKSQSLRIGSFTTTDQLFTIIDIDFPIDGLISLLPFRNLPFTIDYKKKMLTLESTASANALAKNNRVLPMQLSDAGGKALDILINAKLNDTLEVQIVLDSGAGFNVFRFNSRYMEKLGVDSSHTKNQSIPSPFVPTQGNRYYGTTLSKISTGKSPHAVHDIRATFIEGLIYEGITSLNWLGNMITIDIPNRRMVIGL